jgi:hypothetical protein
MSPILGKGLSWVLGALALFVVFSAVRLGAADLLCGHAADRMAKWPQGGGDASSVDGVSRILDAARRIAPDNPDVHETAARLDMVRADRPGADDAERKAALRHGITQIRRAISLRPVSPYGWAILLRLKSGLREYDAEFRRSLERTASLGPWEPELQATVADAGLGAWAALPESERKMVGESIARGMKRQAGTMFAIARAHLARCAAAGRNDAGCAR